jgi:hypothetical protein
MDELYLQLNGSPPNAIVCSVGGGGLLNGIMLGLDDMDGPIMSPSSGWKPGVRTPLQNPSALGT